MTQPTHDDQDRLIDRGDYISGEVHTGIPTGTWIGPANTRIDIAPNPHGGWTSTVYYDTHALTGGQQIHHPHATDVEAAVTRIEAQGYQRRHRHTTTSGPTTRPGIPLPSNRWTPGNIIGALILFAVLTTVLIALVS